MVDRRLRDPGTCPPSEKLSGVTLTMPINSGRRPNASVRVRSFQELARSLVIGHLSLVIVFNESPRTKD